MLISSMDCTVACATGWPCAVSTLPVSLVAAGITTSTLRRSLATSLAVTRAGLKEAPATSSLADSRYWPGNIPSST
jgi:hypothetical protein